MVRGEREREREERKEGGGGCCYTLGSRDVDFLEMFEVAEVLHANRRECAVPHVHCVPKEWRELLGIREKITPMDSEEERGRCLVFSRSEIPSPWTLERERERCLVYIWS